MSLFTHKISLGWPRWVFQQWKPALGSLLVFSLSRCQAFQISGQFSPRIWSACHGRCPSPCSLQSRASSCAPWCKKSLPWKGGYLRRTKLFKEGISVVWKPRGPQTGPPASFPHPHTGTEIILSCGESLWPRPLRASPSSYPSLGSLFKDCRAGLPWWRRD